MNRIELFDLDGTLVDSMPQYNAAMLQILDEEGIAYGDDMVGILTPLSYAQSAELYQRLGVPGTVEEIVCRMQGLLVEQYANHITLKPGVGEYLRKRKAQGARLYVLTASAHIVTDVCLQHNGVWELFDRVWSADEFQMDKGDVRIYHAVAELIGCSTGDITFFDDNLTAASAGAKAGCRTIAVNDRHTPEIAAAIKAATHGYINSFAELL